MIKLCIFDLDGTTLDTVKTIAYYVNTTLENNGIEPIEVEQFKYLAGRGMADLIRRSLEYRGCYEESFYQKVLREYDAAYNANVSYKTTIFEGLKETLDAIKALGIRIAIVSNKPDFATRTVVNELYGEGYFDFVTGQKPGGILKPDPTVVLSVMEQFGATREECLYIGDTSTDMQTGKNAGMFTIGVLWGFRGREELLENGADLLIAKPHELYDHIINAK
jgi:phosphoglycolate phosphatase